MVYTDKNAKLTIKKAVIVKLLLVYLKAALRKLHNTLLASYGEPALSLSKGSTGFTSLVYYLIRCSVIFNSSRALRARRPEGSARTERS